MLKKYTRDEHKVRINEVLYHIFTHLSFKLSIEELAKISSYSSFHFQRIFKEVTHKSVIIYIKDERLQWGANLLVFNPESTITNIAHNCGFKSSTTFSNEFKKYYGMTPSYWRNGGYKTIDASSLKGDINIDFSKIQIKKIDDINIAITRHIGYDKTISDTWKKFLFLLEKEFDIANPTMIGFHHSNPNITSFKNFRYGACIDLGNREIKSIGDIGTGTITGGLFASIRHQGEHNDILYLYKKMYYEWLPSSEFEAVNGKAHMVYHKNNFLEDDGKFDIEFRIPISYK